MIRQNKTQKTTTAQMVNLASLFHCKCASCGRSQCYVERMTAQFVKGVSTGSSLL